MEWKRKAISNNSLRLDGWMNGGTAARFAFILRDFGRRARGG